MNQKCINYEKDLEDDKVYQLNSAPQFAVIKQTSESKFEVIKSPFGFLYPIVSNPFIMGFIGYTISMVGLTLLFKLFICN